MDEDRLAKLERQTEELHQRTVEIATAFVATRVLVTHLLADCAPTETSVAAVLKVLRLKDSPPGMPVGEDADTVARILAFIGQIRELAAEIRLSAELHPARG